MIGRLLIAAALALMAGGCLHNSQPASVAGGECRIFDRPQYAVLGRTAYDQRWIDGNIEGGVAGCAWARPEPRPARLESLGVLPLPVVQPQTVTQKFKARVRKVFRRKPAAAPASAPAPAVVAPAPAPIPAKPRTDLDELLDPRPSTSRSR